VPTQVSPLKRAVQSALRNVTPVRLWLWLSALWFCSLIFGLAAIATIQQHVHAVKTIAADAAPSVFSAYEIKSGVERMDAALVNELLYSPGKIETVEMEDYFEKSRVGVCKQLIAAAKNITYGAAEQTPIENIGIALGQFEMQAQAARDLHNENKHADALKRYRSAMQTLEETLFPNADALVKANADVLEETYAHEKGVSAMSRGFVIVMGLLSVVVLLYTQVYISTRFRRRLNGPLLIATVCVALFLQHVSGALADSSEELKVAKEDAYDSIIALLDARANSYAANTAESRWLLDRGQAALHQKYFFDKLATVARFDKGYDFLNTVALAKTQLAEGERFNLPGFSGTLASELNNIRFEGEAESAFETLYRLSDYCATDAQMRQLGDAGALDAAISLGLGYDPKGSNFLFSKYDDALGRTLDINKHHLQLAEKKALGDLEGLLAYSFILSIMFVVLAYFGIRPRIAEYQAPDYLHHR
jgi:hypothetical protein